MGKIGLEVIVIIVIVYLYLRTRYFSKKFIIARRGLYALRWSEAVNDVTKSQAAYWLGELGYSDKDTKVMYNEWL